MTNLSKHPSNTGEALFSVVVPTYDDRGVVLQAVEAWLTQRTEATPFELIIVDSGNLRLARKIAPCLGSRDQLVSLKSSNEAQLYNYGARFATTDWIVFSEAHVVPSPDMVSKLSRRLNSTSCDAAIMGSTHRTRTRLARVDAQLFRCESDAMRALGLWRNVSLRGFLIRRDLFQKLGTFNEDYLRFSETALAIHIVDRGYLLEEFPEVVIEHYGTDSIRELLVAMSAGRLGAHRFWAAEPELAFAYFNTHHPATPPKTVSNGLARTLWYQLLRAICRGKGRAALRLFRLSKSTLLPAILGWKGGTWKSTIRACLTYIHLMAAMHVGHSPKRNYEPFINLYRSLRETCAEVGSMLFQSESEQDRKPGQFSLPQVVESDEFQNCGLNFYPTEVYQNERYCWSSPQAAIRLVLDSSDCLVCLDARPTGGWLVRNPKLYINGEKIPSENITEESGIVKVFIRSDKKRLLGEAILSWRCSPFRPADLGLPDRRSLGIALIRVNIFKSAASISQPTEVRAA